MTQPSIEPLNDIFISYAHVDNESLTEGQKGWISQFHRTLEIRLRQLLGENPRIWRDMKLAGTDIFDEKILNQFENTRLMISVISPRYVSSEWCARELNEFYNTLESSGGLRVGDKSRIIKVVKTPVDGDPDGGSVHKIFKSLLGFDFFDIDPETGRVREYNEEFGHEAKPTIWSVFTTLHTKSPPSSRKWGEEANRWIRPLPAQAELSIWRK